MPLVLTLGCGKVDDFGDTDDVLKLLPDVLRHRLIISFSGRAQQTVDRQFNY